MSFSTGSPRNSWQPIMTVDTATPSYWLNWRFLVCAACVVVSMVSALFIIPKYDGPRNSKQESREGGEEPAGLLYEDEVWKPCLKGIHPAWLLAFRALAFFVLLVLLILNVAVDGGDIYYYYTQWTSTLITLYFGLGSLLSIYGCIQNHIKMGGEKTLNEKTYDAEQGTYKKNPNASMGGKHSQSDQTRQVRQTAGFWGYTFQIIFQMSAGAVMLTDCVFWLLIVPFLEIKEDYDLNFLIISMHTINAVFLLVDTAFNCLRFPWFRIAYFILWTAIYVVFQWIIHACFSFWWPYPFLDLSSPFAPLWYSLVGLMHIPCFGIFVLVMKIKHSSLSKWFPKSYRCVIDSVDPGPEQNHTRLVNFSMWKIVSMNRRNEGDTSKMTEM